ncbi:dynactin subunit 6 isoform X1 [Neofelis nebulosa]|uniref:dynactin subunit 6 isoform X1 n=1 Tax=Panthera leo TaxID=9689 RepID=UPI000905D313|nr:dynactin subunit 6 isoform X1 [Panthera leo]XP_042839058.1 dynactin subunit 6 isoform X1 [Panthera tigris]XP_049488470.1 dynactin subunit 6 isoform X1 [Panthera uncia]XP_058576154.1 dynactin subunit 6 isoform X1 [Neofelis nebulosa]
MCEDSSGGSSQQPSLLRTAWMGEMLKLTISKSSGVEHPLLPLFERETDTPCFCCSKLKFRVFFYGGSVKIAPGAVVCVESEIRGDVTIGPRTVIHPKARIIAEAGPIVIGEGNLIEEQALIINAHPDNITPDAEDPEPKPMIIGTNNVFEVGCYSQAMKMGDNNVIESKAYVGRNVILTSGCIIGACCNLNTFEVIPENTVIYGADCLRRVQTERPQPQTLQLDFLMKILPNYHHLKKTMKGSSTPVKN